MTDNYDDDQQDLAREFAAKLEGFVEKASTFMSPHAIATAMISTGVGVAMASGSREATVSWLRGIADDLESSAPVAN